MKDRDRFINKSKFLKNQKKEKGLWKTFKENYKEENDMPFILNYNNEISVGPNKMADTFNKAFINKVNNNKKKIPKGEDPLIFYKKCQTRQRTI